MVDIDKLTEQRRELDRKIRAARREEAKKVAEEEAKHYAALGKAVAERFGGEAVGIEARSDAAREQLGLPAAPQPKRRGRPKAKAEVAAESAVSDQQSQPVQQPAQQYAGDGVPSSHFDG